jgi:hypothetical protein
MSADVASADSGRYAHALIGLAAAEICSGGDVGEALDKLAEAHAVLRAAVAYLDEPGCPVGVYSDGHKVASRVSLSRDSAWWSCVTPEHWRPSERPRAWCWVVADGRRVTHTAKQILDVVNDKRVQHPQS